MRMGLRGGWHPRACRAVPAVAQRPPPTDRMPPQPRRRGPHPPATPHRPHTPAGAARGAARAPAARPPGGGLAHARDTWRRSPRPAPGPPGALASAAWAPGGRSSGRARPARGGGRRTAPAVAGSRTPGHTRVSPRTQRPSISRRFGPPRGAVCDRRSRRCPARRAASTPTCCPPWGSSNRCRQQPARPTASPQWTGASAGRAQRRLAWAIWATRPGRARARPAPGRGAGPSPPGQPTGPAAQPRAHAMDNPRASVLPWAGCAVVLRSRREQEHASGACPSIALITDGSS